MEFLALDVTTQRMVLTRSAKCRNFHAAHYFRADAAESAEWIGASRPTDEVD